MPVNSQIAERNALNVSLAEAKNVRAPFLQTLKELNTELTDNSSKLANLGSQIDQGRAEVTSSCAKRDMVNLKIKSKAIKELKGESEECSRHIEELRGRIDRLILVIRGFDRGIAAIEKSINDLGPTVN